MGPSYTPVTDQYHQQEELPDSLYLADYSSSPEPASRNIQKINKIYTIYQKCNIVNPKIGLSPQLWHP